MDEAFNNEPPEPKISDVEIILWGIVFVICDLLDLIPFMGDIIDVIIGFPFMFYLYLKGALLAQSAALAILDLVAKAIPGIQELPLRTAAWIGIVWMDRHPKLESKLVLAEAVAGGAAALGGGAAAGEAGIAAQTASGAETAAEGATSVEAAATRGETLDATQSGKDERGTKNARPSEKSTERGTEERAGGRQKMEGEEPQEESGIPAEELEEEKEREKEEKYEKMMETEAEQAPIEKVKEELFTKEVSKPPGAPANQETPAERQLRERLLKVEKMRAGYKTREAKDLV